MNDNKKKIAIVSLAVFTVFAIVAISVIIYLNTKLNSEPASASEQVAITSEVEDNKVEVKTQTPPPSKPTSSEVSKPVIKEEVVVVENKAPVEEIEEKVEEIIVTTEEVKDPNFEGFKFVQNLDLYGYNCVVTSTDGMTTITYPSELVPVDFLLYVAKEVSEAYPEECSYVTFALEKDLIILSYPNTFTEFDTWLYLDVLASDIPIFASWLYDGTYESVKEEKVEEIVEEAPPVVEQEITPVEIPFTPVTPLPEAPTLSVKEEEIKSEDAIFEEVVKEKEDKGLKVNATLSGGYVMNYVDNLSHGLSVGLGLELENIATFDKLSVGLGLDTGLVLFSDSHSINSDLTLNLRYFVNQKLSIAGKIGARLLFDNNPNSAIFSLGSYNAHFGLVVGADLRYMFNKNMGFGLDVRYSYLLDLGHRAEAKAYMSFTF